MRPHALMVWAEPPMVRLESKNCLVGCWQPRQPASGCIASAPHSCCDPHASPRFCSPLSRARPLLGLTDYGGRVRQLVALTLISSLALSACGGEPSLADYAGELESAVAEMNGRLDQLDAELSENADLEEIKGYARERVAARYAFVAVLDDLEPPSEVSELHIAAEDIIGRLADAEAALASYVDELESGQDIGDLWATPLGIAARAVDVESIELCMAAQSKLDTTERSELAGVPWIPPELKEVVVVAFGCIAEER